MERSWITSEPGISLSGLRQFPVEALKIDRSLVGEMLADRGAYDTVELIILLAAEIEVENCSEGIETAKHLERLRELGCDFGQGYFFFSPPLQPEAASKLLREAAIWPRMRKAPERNR